MICEEINLQDGGKLFTYIHKNSKELWDGKKRPIVILCPGGGYMMTSDREGEGLAIKFLGMDCHAAALNYNVSKGNYPTAFDQLAWSVKYLRENAQKYNIDENKIIVQGSSAGGHLAASYGVFWKEMYKDEIYRPNGLMLSYPVIITKKYKQDECVEYMLGEKNAELLEKLSPEKHVNANTPKTFIWHNFTDKIVPAENSLIFALALKEKGINTELHMFNKGGHGLGTCGKLTASSDGGGISKQNEIWLELAEKWLDRF